MLITYFTAYSTFQLNLSPFLLLQTSLASYLLFSPIRCASFSGACLVGAGSDELASRLGLAAVSPLPMPLAPVF